MVRREKIFLTQNTLPFSTACSTSSIAFQEIVARDPEVIIGS